MRRRRQSFQSAKMSVVGSCVSSCSSAKTCETSDTLLQKCVYVRDYLGLDAFLTRKHDATSIKPNRYVQISSKTLRENYVLPESGVSVNDVFARLAELMRECKDTGKSPPKTDFTCLSRAARRKLFVDVDCLACKRGDIVSDKKHLKTSKLLELTLATIETTFGLTVRTGVYMTNGKSSCGFHVFFNTLAYDYTDPVSAAAAETLLAGALNDAYKRSKMANVAAVDHGCTQMPLPASSHSRSAYRTRPYAVCVGGECENNMLSGKVTKTRLNWIDMDAERLKCFSSIAFSEYHDDVIDLGPPPCFRPPLPPPPPVFGRPSVENPKNEPDTDSEEPVKRKRESSPETSSDTGKRSCRRLSGSGGGYDGTGSSDSDGCTAAPVNDPAVSFRCSPPTSPPRTTIRDDDIVSSVSNFTESATAMSSFHCRRVEKRSRDDKEDYDEDDVSAVSKCTVESKRQKTAVRQRTDTVTAPITDVIERLPYECEDEKTSAFPDKQYKAALLCAEEKEATDSKAALDHENRANGIDRRRVYVDSVNVPRGPREYKLLVQLVNVNRAVYAKDIWLLREWTDLRVSYYDRHLQNPVVLVMLKFVLQDDRVARLFGPAELASAVNSVVYLMTPYRQKREEEQTTNAVDLSVLEEKFERDARQHKSRVVAALVRVSTHLFGMVTAVFSDLWRIQKAKQRKDLSLLNCTVVHGNNRKGVGRKIGRMYDGDDEDLDCSASMCGGDDDDDAGNGERSVVDNYTVLASLIIHEEKNLSDMALYAMLYYYHYFPSTTIDRIIDEIHHDGLMVTAMIRYFLMYDRRGKSLTLQEIFDGFNDSVIALSGPEGYLKLRKKNKSSKGSSGGGTNSTTVAKNKDPDFRRRAKRGARDTAVEEDGTADESADTRASVTPEEVKQLLAGTDKRRRRRMCGKGAGPGNDAVYEWKNKHMWETVIDYYLRPVAIYDDKLVFANDNYDTPEEDAVESFVAHMTMSEKPTKSDVQTAFKDARTAWRMPHGSQLLYECDLRSELLGCCFHINVALKMYEMFCGGCVTRMKRIHGNYLIDRARFNMNVYDVVAECRSAAVNLTSAVDRSYMNLLLRQPIVPPFLEDAEIRRMYMSDAEIQRGSFCCLSPMDYIRALNLFERTSYKCKAELETCEYVEKFLDDLYTGEIAAERPPLRAADGVTRLLYTFYSLYLFEVVFNMRHVYAKRENMYVPIERLSDELDVRELIALFFGESSLKRVNGLDEDLERRIRRAADDWSDVHKRASHSNGTDDASGQTAGGRFDVRPVLAVEIPDKVARMKRLFGQFGFDVMRDGGELVAITTTAVTTIATDSFGTERDVAPADSDSRDSSGSDGGRRQWEDDTKFEQEFYVDEGWLNAAYERVSDRKAIGKTYRKLALTARGGENMFVRETMRTIMRLEAKRHIDNDRLGKLADAARSNGAAFDALVAAMKNLPMRMKLLAFILTVHTIKSKTKTLCPDLLESAYREADGRFADERRLYEGEINDRADSTDPPEKVWCRTTERLLDDRLALLSHARWLADRRFRSNFFVGLDPVQVYKTLYEYMKDNEDRYPAFKSLNADKDTKSAVANLCTAVMFLLIMSAYDQEHVDLYLKVFLAVEWPGQWAKTIFVWKSNSNAGKSYLFDAIVKKACANSTCINDPKGGKDNAPEKAEYVRNFVLFANEFSQANSNELKKLVSESTFKFRMNYGNVMNEAYATGKIMFNCNTLPPTSDEAAINRLTLFSIPFWFCRRQKISDALLNWIRGPGGAPAQWEIAYRHELPSLLTEEEREFLKSHNDTKDEVDLFDEDAAMRQNMYSTEYNKATSSLFLVQNKTSRLYVSSSPPTDEIVHGLVNITTHFSWLRFFKRLDMPVDFTTLPASSEAVRSEWLSLTLPYQEWKQITGARTDAGRVPAESVYRSLQAFASKKNINYFGIRQFFETDFASSREAIKDEYYMWFDSKAFCD